jgi:hypothetical protein
VPEIISDPVANALIAPPLPPAEEVLIFPPTEAERKAVKLTAPEPADELDEVLIPPVVIPPPLI